MNEIERGADENSLIALIEKKKNAFENMSVALRIRRDFEIVSQAREVASWSEISEALGHKGKAGRIRQAYFYEKRRREKEKKRGVELQQEGGIKTAIRQESRQESQRTEIPNLGTAVKKEMTKEQSEKSTWREIKY